MLYLLWRQSIKQWRAAQSLEQAFVFFALGFSKVTDGGTDFAQETALAVNPFVQDNKQESPDKAANGKFQVVVSLQYFDNQIDGQSGQQRTTAKGHHGCNNTVPG